MRRAFLLMDGLERPRRPPQPEEQPALRLVGGVPIADRLVRHLATQGVSDICMAIHQLPGLVVHYFADGAAWGVRIRYVYEQRPLGSGGALAQGSGFCTETTLVLTGSTLTNMPLAPLVEAHHAWGALVTAAVSPARGGRPRPQVELDSEGYLIRYGLLRGGEETLPGGLVDAGVYLVEPGLVGRLPQDTFLDWTRDVLPNLVQERQVRGWRGQGVTLQVSTPEDGRLAETLLDSEEEGPKGP